jgi:hypothetical protein
MPFQQVTELSDIQIQLQCTGFALPRACRQIPLLEEAGIGLFRQCADWHAERFAIDQVRECCALMLTADFRHDSSLLDYAMPALLLVPSLYQNAL